MMGYIYIYIYIYARSSQLTVKDLKQNKHDRKQLHGALLEDAPAYIYIEDAPITNKSASPRESPTDPRPCGVWLTNGGSPNGSVHHGDERG